MSGAGSMHTRARNEQARDNVLTAKIYAVLPTHRQALPLCQQYSLLLSTCAFGILQPVVILNLQLSRGVQPRRRSSAQSSSQCADSFILVVASPCLAADTLPPAAAAAAAALLRWDRHLAFPLMPAALLRRLAQAGLQQVR